MELDLKPIELPGIETKRPMIIAGPCSAETEQQVMDTALMLANKGIKIFRRKKGKSGALHLPDGRAI